MAEFQPKGKRKIHLDMTPLVDVAFLLLTFFMLTAQFNNQYAAKVALPKSKSGGLAPQTHSLTISVAENELISFKIESQTISDSILNYKPNTVELVSLTRLDSLISLTVKTDTTLQFILRADRNIPYGKVNSIITMLKENRVKKFNLLTEGN